MSRRRKRELGRVILEAETEVTVRFQEVDALRVVWHGHYLSYFEEARNAFGRRYEFTYQDILEAGYVAPLVHVELDYMRPARFDQNLRVVARMHEDPGARIVFSYEISDGEGQTLVTGNSVQAFTDKDGQLVLCRTDFHTAFLERWTAP